MSFTPRPYQTDAINNSIAFFNDKREKKNGLVIAPTGSGKSVLIANIAGKLPGKTLILQPSKEILEQNFSKFLSYGYRAGVYSASAGMKFMDTVTFATIGSIAKKHHIVEKVDRIIIDECFPAGSLVDGIPIEKLKVGFYVNSFNHITEKIEQKKIIRLFRNELKCQFVKIKVAGGFFLCTTNHPIYTKEKGYIPAKELTLCKTNSFTLLKECLNEPKNNKELHSLWGCCKKKRAHKRCKCFLFRRMQSNSSGIKKEKPIIQLPSMQKIFFSCWKKRYSFSKEGASILFKRMRRNWQVNRKRRSFAINNKFISIPKRIIQTNEKKQSNVDARSKRKNDIGNKGKNFYWTWWKRSINQAANDLALSNRVSDGIPYRNRINKTLISIGSELLQSGFGMARKENSYRSRWRITQTKEVEVFGSSENGNFEFIRMESAEIYESGNRCEPKKGCEKNYVYNIEVEDNHNYFVSGILVHNCHLVNPETGMYHDLIHSFERIKVLGLTATPYRLGSSMDGAMLKFITRQSPRIFNKVIYEIQNDILFNAGYLAPLQYFSFKVIDRAKLETNSTGTDFNEQRLKQYYREIGMPEKIIHYANRILTKRKNLLVFCSMISEANAAAAGIPGAVVLTGETDPNQRTSIIKNFKSGIIKCLIVVGMLGTGFDFPGLEAVLIGRSMMSLALYYQFIGRVMRPFIYPDGTKKIGWVVDLGDNIRMFGKIETMKIMQDDRGLYSVWNVVNGIGRQLTNVVFRKT